MDMLDVGESRRDMSVNETGWKSFHAHVLGSSSHLGSYTTSTRLDCKVLILVTKC